MRKNRLSLILLLIVAMMVSLLPSFTVQAALGSKSYTFEDTTNVKRRGFYGVIKNVDFGERGFTAIDLVHQSGTDTNAPIFDIRIDSTVGQQVTALYEVDIESGYSPYSNRTDRIQISGNVTGVHDVYFYLSSGETFFKTATFYYFEGSATLYKTYGETNRFKDALEFSSPDKVNFLADLGILDTSKDALDPTLPVTRIEILKAISKFYDVAELPQVPVGIFMDIPDEVDRQIAYFLYLKGVVILENTGYLEPHEYIKPFEAAEYLANMLGYNGDMRVAAKLKAGTDSADGHLRRDQMVEMLCKALFQGYRVGYKTENGAVWYDEYDKCVLNYTKGWELAEGLVSATSYTSLYSAADTTGEYQVRINDTEYSVGTTAADEYLGIYCYYIYAEDANGEEVIKGIVPKNPDYITQLDHTPDYTEISLSKIEYMNEKGKLEDIELTGTTCIVYNGKALDVDISTVITNPADFRGKIIAIDNNRDKLCDSLIITNAKSMVLGSVTEQYVTSLTNSLDAYNFEENSRAEFIKYGKIANAVDFNLKECVDVYASVNTTGSKLYRIVASSLAEEGSVTGISSDSKLTIDGGSAYSLSPYASYSANVGDTGTFLINAFDEIVYFIPASQSDVKVGWLYKVILNDEEEVAFAVFKTTGNETVRYQFAERVYVDGVRVKKYDGLKTGGSGATTAMSTKAGIALSEPILYKLDANNMITVIDTADTTGTQPVTTYNQLIQLLPMATYYSEQGAIFDGASENASAGSNNTNYMDGPRAYYSSSDMMVYNEATFAGADDRHHSFRKGGSISYQGEELSCYTYGEKRTVDLVHKRGTGSGAMVHPFIVTKLETFVDSYGEVGTRIKGINESGEVSYTINQSVASTDADLTAAVAVVKPGDLVSANNDGNNIVSSLKIIHYGDNDDYTDTSNLTKTYNGTDVTSLFTNTVDCYALNWLDKVMIGTVEEIGSDYIRVKRLNHTFSEYIALKNLKVINAGENGLDIDTTLSTGALKVGLKVIGYYYYYSPKTFYIFNNLN